MKKSEIIRQASKRVRRVNQIRYCTPSRNMLFSLEAAADQLPVAERRSVIAELATAIANKMRDALGWNRHVSLEELDEEDDGGFTLSDEIVSDAFEKTAQMYEEHGE